MNQQQWLPDFTPPYVVANIALDEDPMVRLTTNIVGCDPDDVSIGMPVVADFQPQERTDGELFGVVRFRPAATDS